MTDHPHAPGAPASAGGAGRVPVVGRVLPFVIAGLLCVVVGGLLSAATAYVTTEKTAWATAYLVLVGGVAQLGLGAALGWLAPRAGLATTGLAFVLWNLGNAGVLAGQLTGILALTFIGGALLVIALIVIVVATVQGNAHRRPLHPGWLWAFRALVVLLAVTIPIGLVLAAVGD